jgi:actin-related protein 8
VVDIGHTQTTVTCVEEGLILNGTQVKKHFGGADIDDVLLRMMRKKNAIHFKNKTERF